MSARFEIYLDEKDLDLLILIKSYFGGAGSILRDRKRNKASFSMNKFEDFVNILIPHFNKFPLQSAKQFDYSLWLECIRLMENKEHLTQAGLDKILSIKASLNRGLPEKIAKEFLYITKREKPVSVSSNVNEPLNPQWISGFSDGDSSFFVNENKKTQGLQPVFKINLHEKESALLLRIQRFFEGSGHINTYEAGRSVN